jgi:hypothetical protein
MLHRRLAAPLQLQLQLQKAECLSPLTYLTRSFTWVQRRVAGCELCCTVLLPASMSIGVICVAHGVHGRLCCLV